MLSAPTQRVLGITEAQTIRPPSTALLTIDSGDRWKSLTDARNATSSSYNFSPYDFTITKNESIMNGFFTRLSVSEVVFPWVIPNINTRTATMQFQYQPGGVGPVFNQVIDFTDDLGFYRPSQIASTLQAKCAVYVPGMLVEYSPLAVVGNDGLPLCFYCYDGAGTDLFSFSPMPINDPSYPYNGQTIQLFDILGFNSSVQTLGPAHFGGQTLCQDVRSVDIVCSLLTYNQSLKDTSSQVTVRDSLCRIYLADGGTQNTGIIEPNDPLFCPPGCAPTTIYRNFNTPKQIQWIPNQPISSGLRFQLFDDNGNPLTDVGEDPGVINWSMSLLVTEN